MDEENLIDIGQIRFIQPPIGIIPRWLYDEQCKIQRFKDLGDTMDRYINAGYPIKKEWTDEYYDLYFELSIIPNLFEKEKLPTIKFGR